VAGYQFGQIEWVREHFEVVVVAVIVISVLPMAVEFVLAWRRGQVGKEDQAQVRLTAAEPPVKAGEAV
jgi:hypothetical protein